MDKDRIAGAAKDFAGQTEGAIGDLTGDAETKVSGRAREASGKAQNLYGQAKDQIKDAARNVSDTAAGYARDAYESSGDTLRDGTEALTRKVQDNPLGALLIAGGIGFALALLMTRPPRRPPPRWRYDR
jgi:uncharacterized protein YjbJ (UPF0337 family)